MSSTPPPPCFSDVVEAQEWASKLVKQTEEEANRRGRRGSHAWEDAWRDALWTLAVQKRCVEVEAKKRCNSTADPSSSVAAPGVSFGQSSGVAPAAAGRAQQKASAGLSDGIAALHGNCMDAPRSNKVQRAEEALREGAERLERRCIQMVNERLEGVEGNILKLRVGLDAVKLARENVTQLTTFNAALPAYAPGSAAAGPLPSGVGSNVMATAVTFAELQCQLGDHATIAERQASRAARESQRRHEAEERCLVAERELEKVELACEGAKAASRQAERRAEEEANKRLAAEASWQQRHQSLQRQLRRTEIALGEEHVMNHSGSAGQAERDIDETEPQHTGLRAAADSRAVLKVLREVRGLEQASATRL